MPKSFEAARKFQPVNTKTLNQEFQILLALVCEAISEFRHYDPKRIAVSIGRSRSQTRGGTWAYVVPLRYVGGRVFRRGARGPHRGYYLYKSDDIEKRHPGALYLMTFLVPRFFMLSSQERLETVVHELYHLHPELRGDLRRFAKPHLHHGPTPAAYNKKVRELTAEALRHTPQLLGHPLISGRGDEFEMHKRGRLSIPRRVFCVGPVPAHLDQRTPPLMLPAKPVLPPVEVASQPSLLIAKPESESVRRPEQLWLFIALVALLFLGAVCSARAAEGGAVAKRTILFFAKPSAAAAKLSRFPKGQSFNVLRLSANKKWVLLQAPGGRKGWTPANWLNISTAPPAAEAKPDDAMKSVEEALGEGIDDEDIAKMDASSKNSDDPEAGIGNDSNFVSGGEAGIKDSRLAAFDKKAERFFAKKKGKLFDRPTRFANRYAVIEAGDELFILRRSPKGKWAQVRLKITGEEGWFPMPWIEARRPERLDRSGDVAVSFYTGLGSAGLKLGFGAGFAVNVLSQGLENSPRDRVEIGADGALWLGESFSQNDVAFKSSFLTGAFFGRYIASSESGFLGFGGEAGLSLTKVKISSEGADPDVLDAIGLKDGDLQIGLLLGAVGYWALSPSFFLEGGARIQFSSRTSVVSRVGANLRF